MATKQQIAKATQICRTVINEWDPYCLIAKGAPDDEFESEIASIIRQIDRIRSKNDAAHVVARIFSSAFEFEYFAVEACADVGATLFNRLVDAKLVMFE